MKSNFWQKLNHPILALAPMAGITDSPFRQICKSFGADVVYTEMVSADGLAHKSKKTLELLRFDKSERPIVVQLFGKNPENFKKAINLINQFPNDKLLITSDESDKTNIANTLLSPDGIDINFGCPAKKVVSSGHGVALMNNAKLAGEIVRAIKESTKLPVSVKTRLGFKNKNEILTFGPKMEEAGADALCVHARTYKQGFSGPADLEIIKKLKDKIKIPLIVNGGIYKPEDAKKALDETRAEGLMIAQGALGKPWIFKQIKDYFKTGEYRNPSWFQIKKTALKHAALAYKFKGEHGITEMRKHLAWYARGQANASELRQKLVRAETVEEIEAIL